MCHIQVLRIGNPVDEQSPIDVTLRGGLVPAQRAEDHDTGVFRVESRERFSQVQEIFLGEGPRVGKIPPFASQLLGK